VKSVHNTNCTKHFVVLWKNETNQTEQALPPSQARFYCGRCRVIDDRRSRRPYAPSQRRAGMRALVEGEKGEEEKPAIGYKRWWVGCVLSNQPIAGVVPQAKS